MQFLKGTRDELEEQNEPLRLGTGLLDQALLEAASNQKGGTTPLEYLLSCWKRVSKQYKALRKGGEHDPKSNVIKEARRLCMSYCIFAITMPDMFG
jgi:ubiquitin conjugation factor E4 B